MCALSSEKVKRFNPSTGKDLSDPELEKLVISKLTSPLDLYGVDVTTEDVDVDKLHLPSGLDVYTVD